MLGATALVYDLLAVRTRMSTGDSQVMMYLQCTLTIHINQYHSNTCVYRRHDATLVVHRHVSFDWTRRARVTCEL